MYNFGTHLWAESSDPENLGSSSPVVLTWSQGLCPLQKKALLHRPWSKGRAGESMAYLCPQGWLSPAMPPALQSWGCSWLWGAGPDSPEAVSWERSFSRDNVFSAVLLCTASTALVVVTSPVLRPIGGIDRISFIRPCWINYLKENSEVRRQWGNKKKIKIIPSKRSTSTFYVKMVKQLSGLPKQAVVSNFRII